jgi:hypothetical protein
MDDSLSHALDEAPTKHLQPAPQVVERHTPRRRELAAILEEVKVQASNAMRVPFFDGGVDEGRDPVVQSGLTEAGTVHVSARRVKPPYQVHVMIYVRSEKESPQAGHFQARARCEVSSDVQTPPLHREFSIAVTVADDGTETIDVDQLREELADTIRSFGKPSGAPQR